MDLDAFRTRYPEFDPISDDDFVEAVLEEADLELAPTGDWGDRRDTAQGLLTADKLWNSPLGATLRLDGGDKEQSSRYRDAFDLLVKKTFPAVMVL